METVAGGAAGRSGRASHLDLPSIHFHSCRHRIHGCGSAGGARNWAKLTRVSVAFTMWAVSLAACYLLTLRRLSQDNYLLDYWKNNFMPFPPRSVTDGKWFVDTFFGFFSGTAGLEFTGLAAFVFIVGSVSMFHRNRERLFLLLSPAVATLIASRSLYPFGGRLALFLVPATILLMAEGAAEVWKVAGSRLPVVGFALVGCFVPGSWYVRGASFRQAPC